MVGISNLKEQCSLLFSQLLTKILNIESFLLSNFNLKSQGLVFTSSFSTFHIDPNILDPTSNYAFSRTSSHGSNSILKIKPKVEFKMDNENPH